MKENLKRQQGWAAVEVIIATPVLLFFLVLTLELGNILIHYNVISKSVQNGARYAVSEVYGTQTGTLAPTSEIQNVVVYGKNSTGTALLSNLSTANVTVTPPSTDDYVRVSVDYSYVPHFIGIPFSSEGFSIPLKVSSVMRVL
jgi:Flp pilus assembly protein TadG